MFNDSSNKTSALLQLGNQLLVKLSKGFSERNFYASKSKLSLAVTHDFESLRVTVVKAYPNMEGKPSKGVHKYDHTRLACFSLSVSDCYNLHANLRGLVDGTYNNGTQGENANALSIEHYPIPKKKSFISFRQAKGNNPAVGNGILVTINTPNRQSIEERLNMSYSLFGGELVQFAYILEGMYKHIPIIHLAFASVFKSMKKSLFDDITAPPQQVQQPQYQQPMQTQQPQEQPSYFGQYVPPYYDNMNKQP
jgi:hypothetical protein